MRYLIVPNSRRLQSAWKWLDFVPIIGWFISSMIDEKRLAPIVEEFHGILDERTDFCLSAWTPVDCQSDLVGRVRRILAQVYHWKTDRFLPGDEVAAIAICDRGEFFSAVLLPICDSVGIDESKEIDQVFNLLEKPTATLQQFVEHLEQRVTIKLDKDTKSIGR